MSTTQPGGLGRRFAPDERDRNFPMAAAFAPVPTPNSRYWALSAILDQGRTSMCVGFSGRQWLGMSPVRYKQAQPDAPTLYHGAQTLDDWPGEDYEGTSARGLMKFCQTLGLVQSYVWAQSVEELCQFVLTTGPALIGSNWHSDMFSPLNGYVKPTGPVVGGHEYVLYGVNHRTGILSFCNSWGTGFGLKGRFKMTRADFEQLMLDQGDMVSAVESPVV